MLKYLLSLLPALLCLGTLNAANGDTTILVAHTNTNLNSPPSDDDIWAVFPNTGTTYQQVILKFTLGCGTPNCSGWDYTVNTLLGKKNGALDSAIVSIDTTTLDTTWSYSDQVEYIEVGRLITPYGTYMAAGSNGFNNSWTHPYYYDVTDYVQLLKDSVSVRVHYDGWTDAFSAKIEFIMIEGDPSRVVESVREVYHNYFGYANSADFESQATPRVLTISPQVTSAKVVINMTGHGSQGEFDPHNIHLKVNGNTIYTRLLWKEDCGLTAIAPQGGTWIFNRANWCPGEKVSLYEIDITPYITPGESITLDLDMDDYTVGAGEGAGYGTSVHLVTYTTQHNSDVMLEEIISPNNDKNYLRFNPISTQPQVKIKNMGKVPLTHADIAYWIKGGNKFYYEWTGNLAPFQSATITLPALDWNGLDTAERVFYAEASWPNALPDEYAANNKLETRFNMTPKLDSTFMVYFRSNNHPEENWYLIRNEDGDTIVFKNTFVPTTTYKDTVLLAPGSYAFDFYDYDAQWGGGDGISWWLNTQQGFETAGMLSLRRLNGTTIIKSFSGDFGSNVHYEFTVGYLLGANPAKPIQEPPVHSTGIADVAATADLQLIPNPAKNVVFVNINTNYAINGDIVLTDIAGKALAAYNANGNGEYKVAISVSGLAKGMYLVSLRTKGSTITKKLIVE